MAFLDIIYWTLGMKNIFRICNSVMITERKFTRKEYYIAFMNERSFGVSRDSNFNLVVCRDWYLGPFTGF